MTPAFLVRWALVTCSVCSIGCTQVVRGRGLDGSARPGDASVDPTDVAELDSATDLDAATCDVPGSPGCDWFFGSPHPLDGVELSGEDHLSPWMSPDGHRLYFVTSVMGAPRQLYVAERTGADAELGAPTPVALTLPTGAVPDHCTVSSDETEVICAATLDGRSHLHRMVRVVGAPFGPSEQILGSGPFEEFEPTLRSDGLELLYITDRRPGLPLWHAVRGAALAAFPEPGAMEVVDVADLRMPFLLPDGLTLLYSRTDDPALRIAGRDAMTDETFHSSLGLGLGRTWFGSFAPATRELIFTAQAPWNIQEDRWNLWRVQVCQGAPCVPERRAECAGGMISPDGFHCYARTLGNDTWAGSESECVRQGGHLVSVNSLAESGVVTELSAGFEAWVGLHDGLDGAPADDAFAWASRSPLNYVAWGVGQPDGTGPRGVLQRAGAWDDRGEAAELHPGICEIEVWPTW
jgi:hypothetical protein